MSEEITLYPSNWLYNAGVIGFLDTILVNKNISDNDITINSSLKINSDYIKQILFENKVKFGIPFWHYHYIMKKRDIYLNNIKSTKKKSKKSDDQKNKEKKVQYKFEGKTYEIDINKVDDGEISIEKDSIEEFLYVFRKYSASLFSKNMLYSSFYPPSKVSDLNYFIDYFNDNKVFRTIETKSYRCSFCGDNNYELFPLDGKFMNQLMPSQSGFPNSFWNCNSEGIDKICSFCQFLLIHHHLAFTNLSDGSEIFINAPSFEIMYQMNKLVKELFGKEKLSEKQKREILAMSVIEYSRRLNVSLGMWNQMNLEIIIKSRDGIDSYSLPYHIVNLISDRKIASLLSEIGEFSVLNIVLNGEEKRVIEIGNKLIKIGLKPYQDRNKSDNAVVNSFLRREKNKNNIINTAQKILELYVNISERRKIYA